MPFSTQSKALQQLQICLPDIFCLYKNISLPVTWMSLMKPFFLNNHNFSKTQSSN